MRKTQVSALGIGLLLLPAVAGAQETTTYSYDAKGRVVTTVRSGGPANGTTTTYTYDAADNRSNVTVVNSPNGGGNDGGSGATAKTTMIIVVPLNGLSVLTIQR